MSKEIEVKNKRTPLANAVLKNRVEKTKEQLDSLRGLFSKIDERIEILEFRTESWVKSIVHKKVTLHFLRDSLELETEKLANAVIIRSTEVLLKERQELSDLRASRQELTLVIEGIEIVIARAKKQEARELKLGSVFEFIEPSDNKTIISQIPHNTSQIEKLDELNKRITVLRHSINALISLKVSQ